MRHLRWVSISCGYSLLFLVLFLGVTTAFADDTEWTGPIGGTGEENAVLLPHEDHSPFKGSVLVNVTNTGDQPWGDFHFQIYDPMGTQDISNVSFLDEGFGGEDPTSSQSPLLWMIDNVSIGARMDLRYYSDPVLPGESAWFQVYTANPDSIPFFGVMFYPTPVVDLACCYEDASCVVLPMDQCEAAGGTSYFEETCDPNPCVWVPVCACCLPLDDACYMMNAEDCEDAGGIWYFDEACAGAGGTVECPWWRVCCIEGACYVYTEGTCEEALGIWHPEEGECTPTSCTPTPTAPESWGGIKSAYR